MPRILRYCIRATNNTIFSAPLRDYFFSSRKGAKTAKNFNVYFVLTPNTSACSASLRDYICFFSLAEAQGSQRNSKLILFLPETPLRALRLGEKFYVFLSQRRCLHDTCQDRVNMVTRPWSVILDANFSTVFDLLTKEYQQ